MSDPYIYPGSDVLRNILNIKDRKELDGAEADYISLRLRELAECPLAGNYDFTHITKMHEYIFQDIYAFKP